VAQPKKENRSVPQEPSVQPIFDTYRAWVKALAGYMSSAVELLDGLYADQDRMIEQLKEALARQHSLRHCDFDEVFGKVLQQRQRTRKDLSILVEAYRASREAIAQEVEQLFVNNVAEAAQAWPVLKSRLLSEEDNGAAEVVAILRRVHMEQEELSTALSGLLTRAEKLRAKDLKAVVGRLADRASGESKELVALLAMCEGAARSAGLKWQRLAG
jgi:hypothetical protein